MISAGINSLLEEVLQGRAEILGLTVQQYDSLLEQGKLPEDPTTELIDGLIVRKDRSHVGEDPMTVGDRHRILVLRLMRFAPQAESLGCFAQSQMPIAIPPNNEPEPDFAIIRGSIEQYRDRKPGPQDVACVIEVSDSSLKRDLGTKLRVYAEAGIEQYVVIDLLENMVLVHEGATNGIYPPPNTLRAGDVLQLSAGTAGNIAVDLRGLLD